jgi:hypothetical protein
MATAYTKAQIDAVKLPGHLDPVKKPGRGVLHLKVQTLDFDAIATSTGVALAADDTFDAIILEAGEVAITAGIRVDQVTTGACTMDLGDGTSLDWFVDGQAANDLTGTYTKTDGYAQGDLFAPPTATRTIQLKTLTASGAGGIVTVWALVARI